MALWRGSGMNATEYKQYHESFMEHQQGSSAIHTFFCIFITIQSTLIVAIRNKKSSYGFEYFFIIFTMILANTILSNYVTQFNCALSAVLLCQFGVHLQKINIKESLNKQNHFQTKHIQSITCLRGLTYLITVFAILAVDFKIFPRYLAKTENRGFSFMDTGVGLFVLMSGVVQKDIHKLNFKTLIQSNFKFVTILFVLGITRFWTVKSLDYQEHVTEYGLHWNFFFTLAVCKITSTFLLFFSNRALHLSVLILGVHELILYDRLEKWVFSDIPRTDLLSANREGISSSLGYTSLFLFAVYIKQVLNDTSVKRYMIILKFIFLSGFLWFLLHYVNIYRPSSRTLCNASYCIFLGAIFVTKLCLMYFLEVIFQNKEQQLSFIVPKVISICNENGFIFFLIANLFTGAINLTIQTLFVPDFAAFIIVNCYMIATLTISGYLRQKGWRI